MSQIRIQSGPPTALLRAATIARLVLITCGAIAAVLGLLLWAGMSTWLPLHMLVGIGLTAALITLAMLAWIAGVNRGLVVLALLWSVVVPLLGYTQTGLLLGPFHSVIEVVHLLIGIGAIVLGQLLAARIRQILNG